MLGATIVASLLLLTGRAFAQLPERPPLLPKAPPPAKDEAPPAPLKLLAFDPNTVSLRQTSRGGVQLWADKQLLKDFGALQKEAEEALRVIRQLGLSRYGTIPGAQPPFELWLVDGWGPEPVVPKAWGALRQIVPFDLRSLRVEQVAGVWCVRDSGRVLFNFGRDAAGAQAALAVCKNYGCNQLGVLGTPNPLMTLLTVDPLAGVHAKQTAPNPLEMQDSLARIGLVIPHVGQVGTHAKIEPRRLDVLRDRDGWTLLHGSDVLASFGWEEQSARAALRAMQDWKVNELAKIGSSGFPLLLVNGRPPRGVPLGLPARGFQPLQLKVQQVNGGWWLSENNRPVLDCGNEQDANLMLKVIQFYGFDQLVRFGHPLKDDGLRLLVKGR